MEEEEITRKREKSYAKIYLKRKVKIVSRLIFICLI